MNLAAGKKCLLRFLKDDLQSCMIWQEGGAEEVT
jgi:hypothetical protein